ncbi:MAG: GFA family protein, partial [Alloalcanivorax xenomutans]
GLHGASRHYFCPHCMSWMFTRPEGVEEFVNIRPGILDQPVWSKPFIETFTSEKLPWASTPAKHSFEQFPPFEAYGELIREYAEQS